jgi:hypothetical protein
VFHRIAQAESRAYIAHAASRRTARMPLAVIAVATGICFATAAALIAFALGR